MGLRTDIGLQCAAARGSTDTYADNLETEVLIVGAGFGGIYLLHKLRDELGLKCKVYEAGKDLGGVWHWNCYPGARVDTSVPLYELSFERVWKDWTWKEKYPAYRELRQYFDHVDKQLDIKRDVAFDTRVVAADFDKETCKWVVKTEDGRTARCTYFLLATGFAAKRHFPDWKGLGTFKGVMHHSSFWPEEGVEIKAKRVAVIGTGATGVQLTQECAKDAAELTVFQRTPNLALPMRQRKLTKEEQDAAKDDYAQIYKHRLSTFGGFLSDRSGKMTFDDTPQQRQAFFEKPWENGGFEFWLANYDDMLLDAKANREAYDFWAKKTRSRLHDPVKKDILAPLEPPHAFGTKRPSLEQDYYEQFNKPNVHVVDVKETPIVEVTPTGIVTADGKLHEVDIIALATGFDSLTGGMKNMGLKDADGVDLSEKWKTGTWSYLGMTCNGYPNMFFLYGPQGPTAFSNGPSCVEIQADWIIDTIAALRKESIKTIEATKEAEEEWRQIVTALSDATLFPGTSSWYMGANVPGKPREQLNYLGGLPRYGQECRERLDGWKGFTVVR
ncbi:hypothetical protein MMC27_003661 [Xylographa pallens]|nr:hypothetical protein [Xylographa pallens]